MLTRFFANGWNRVWIVLVAVQGTWVVAWGAGLMAPSLEFDGDLARSIGVIFAGVALVELGIIHGIAWVVRGFRTPPPAR